ncbi:MAG: Sigma-54 dependent transcriptional regulator [Myxococcaceae bacterium]|nr:Sigma-54 dependent transcriptional regulator [Myxococcaceae bacterium]
MSEQQVCSTPFEQGGKLCRSCRLLPEKAAGRNCSRLVARSKAMQSLLVRAATIAGTDASIVLRGESGSGKEVVARSIHANSPRRANAFVAINCAAMPSELLESELFGHARGAFTGATTARKGLFETADKGMLFLDEIAEMPLSLQAKLLRALQDGEIRRVGESNPFTVDVRVMCATHQNLQLAVQHKRFREDLYFRLKVFTLVVPPLRERLEDIMPLAEIFLQQEPHRTQRFTPKAAARLRHYRWPGNVRELQNAVKHGAVLSLGEEIDVAHLPEELFAEPGAQPEGAEPPPRGRITLAAAERLHILEVMESCGGHQTQAAQVLGVGRTTLWRKLKQHGLDG